MGVGWAETRCIRGRKEGFSKGHREVELDVDFKSQVFWLEPDWSHGMEKGHRGGESRSARVRVWGSLGHVAPVECRVCMRSGRSKGRR